MKTRTKCRDLDAVRDATGLTIQEIAPLLGLSLPSLYGWQQGRSKPRGAVLRLMRLIVIQPELVAWLRTFGKKPVTAVPGENDDL